MGKVGRFGRKLQGSSSPWTSARTWSDPGETLLPTDILSALKTGNGRSFLANHISPPYSLQATRNGFNLFVQRDFNAKINWLLCYFVGTVLLKKMCQNVIFLSRFDGLTCCLHLFRNQVVECFVRFNVSHLSKNYIVGVLSYPHITC